MRAQRLIATSLVPLMALLVCAAPAFAQMAPLTLRTEPVQRDSGIVENFGSEPAVVFSHEVTFPGAAWVRLKFDKVQLAGLVGSGQESYLLITSLTDGAFQYLNAVHLQDWQNHTAYFNGDTVLVELIAHPGTGPNQIIIAAAITGESDGSDSICGPTDDRVLSYDNRAGRLVPIGCTAWLINDCQHCLLTAGHCTSSAQTVEFNVPLSTPSGQIVHPGPEDQYAVDAASMQTNGGQGIGNDYAYFGCRPNSNTGKTPYQAYGMCYELELPTAPAGRHIRITGYGTVSSPVSPTWNQVQKTHVGPYAFFGGTEVGYQTDTTGGNSGSPVILEENNTAIGIHTHGGCSTNYNHGTGLNHPGLQGYLANPKGVCICPPGLVVEPAGDFEAGGDPGGPFTPGFADYTLKNMSSNPFDYEVTKTVDWLTLQNATGTILAGQSAVVRVEINAQANALPIGKYSDVVQFINLTTHEGDTERDVRLEVGGPKQLHFWGLESDPGWQTQGLWAWGQPTGQGGNHGSKDPTAGYTGDNVYGYNLDGDYTDSMPEYHLTTAAFDCSRATGVTLKFKAWLGVERKLYDHAYVRVSTDGTNWATAWENPDSEMAAGSWEDMEIDISQWADDEETVYLRWTMGVTDVGWTYCGWNIDDIEIWGLVALELLGDVNCDGVVDFGDINPFVLALTDPQGYQQAYPFCPKFNSDINADGKVDFNDINPFVALLTNP